MSRSLHNLAGLTVVWLAAVQAAIAQPSLSEATLGGLPPGEPVELSLHGDKLEGQLRIWCATPAHIEQITPGTDGKSVTFKITVDALAPVGVTGLVVANALGVSDPLMLMVDDMDSARDNGANHGVEDAQAITIPAAVDGRSDGVQADYYRFHARQGQRVSIEVVAQRMASSMDAVIRLLDAQYKEVMLADDDAGLGADCRLQHICEQAGDYFIEIRDNRFQAGGTYRLRVGDFPIITSPMPLGGRLGSTALFRFAGEDAANVSPLICSIPHSVSTVCLGMNVKATGGVCSAMTTIATSDWPEYVEVEPNNNLGESTSVTLPCAVSGVLQSERDEDFYEYAVTKGQRIDLTAYGRRFGSPAYVFMTLYDADGKVAAESQIADREEFTLSYTAPTDGLYRLGARDLLHRGGASFAYRIEMRSGPDFSLVLKNDKSANIKFHLRRGDGACALTVEAKRRGYDGQIRLELDKAGDGLRVYNNVIPAKANEVRMFVATSPDFEEAELRMIRVVGIADISGREVHRPMRTEPSLRAKMPQVLYPPGWYDGLVAITTIGPAKPFFDLQSDQEAVELTQGSGEYVFHLERLEKEFTSAINVFPEDLPPGFEASVKSDKDTYTVTITGDEAATSEFEVRLVTIGEHQGRGQVLVKKVPVRIVQ